ncbi:MAG: hypothetical protein AUJ41_02850 [Candidatus Pacebacteria bacterium CG1_02_43_31]|nr:MAG: hypothetical protein AUJ41_02850 [Candidatus Pacebacteria bacterium CG1_02_43_31]
MNNFDKKNWQKIKFGDIVKEVRVAEHKPLKNSLSRYVGLEHIESEDLHITSWEDITDGTTFTRKFVEGQVLFGRRRAYLKKAALADFDGICSGDILVFETIKDKLLPELLPFIVQNDNFFQFAVDASAGSLSPRVKFKDLAKFELMLPKSLDEQKKLSDLLWAGDELVQKYIKEFDSIQIYKNKYFRENYQLDSSNKKVKISSLFELNPSKEKLSNNQLVSFISMEDVTEDGIIENKTDRKYEEVSTGYKSFINGDILFAKITPCMENGKGAIASNLTNGFGFGSTEFHILRPINDSDRPYLYHLSQSPFFRWLAERQMTGSAGQKRVPSDFLLNFKLSLPSLEKRIEIGNKMSEFDQILELINKNITVTKLVNDSIKNEIFS